MKTVKRIDRAWMIAAVILGFTATTNSAHADAILVSPGTGPSDNIRNGGFEIGSTTTVNRAYSALKGWFNAGGGTNVIAAASDRERTGTYGGSVALTQTGASKPAVATGHRIAAGDMFSLTFYHGYAEYWIVGTDTIKVVLYSTSGEIWSDTVSPSTDAKAGAFAEFTANINNIPAANIGQALFLRFELVTPPAGAAQKFAAVDDITLTVSRVPASFPLTITPATAPATGFDLEWERQAGKLYNLRTSTDLANPISGWDLVEGGIAATPPANSKNVPADGARRFYAVEEFAAPPPPPLLEEDFESDNGGFTTSADAGTAWQWGDPDSTGFGGTVSADNNGSTNCWGTGIANPGFYANPTTNSRLISPAIDLTSVAAAELGFAHAIDLDAGDSAVVRIFNTGTGDEIAAGNFPLMITDPNPSQAPWVSSGPHVLPVGAPIRIEWILNGTGGATQDFLGWYIDDLVVTETTP